VKFRDDEFESIGIGFRAVTSKGSPPSIDTKTFPSGT